MNFELKIINLNWINDEPDAPTDLCLHGRVFVRIGEKIIDNGTESWTVSAGAYRMLKSLYGNHVAGEGFNLLPCCGHDIFIYEKTGELVIMGCPNGNDWSVIHENGMVKIKADNDKQIVISLDEYRGIVFRFADEIKDFYDNCSPKTPDPECDIVAYRKFWENWEQMRNGNSIK